MNTHDLSFKLLDHPFYQDWTAGKITKTQLSQYAQSYLELVCEIPNLWQKIIHNLGEKSEIATQVVKEELAHIELWEKWQKEIPAKNCPSLKTLIEALQKMSPSELLGAVQSFEIQQPEVAKTKKEGLMIHYGFSASQLTYFDEHMNEEVHINFGHDLARRHGNIKEFESGFKKGSELFYNALDLFIEKK